MLLRGIPSEKMCIVLISESVRYYAQAHAAGWLRDFCYHILGHQSRPGGQTYRAFKLRVCQGVLKRVSLWY